MSCEQLGILSKGFVPSNTNEWSIKNFLAWQEWRNRSASDSVPLDVLSCTDAVVLNKWLSICQWKPEEWMEAVLLLIRCGVAKAVYV